MPGRGFISSREWVAITALGFLLGMVTMAVASSLSSDKATLIVLAPGFFLQELAGAGGHDENGYFLLVLGQFLFCSGIVLAIFVAIKLWLRRQQSQKTYSRPQIDTLRSRRS